jgi:NSS family neurotransmitter:Na+ symporter
VTIFNEAGQLIDSDNLIFNVLPALFATMGFAGVIVAFLFFALMTIAALTSSISMLEVPVAFAADSMKLSRKRASIVVGGLVLSISLVIIFNFNLLFGLVITFTTKYSEPLIGLLFCVFVGWVWSRQQILAEIRQGSENVENSVFWKIWPAYVKFVCPLLIVALFWRSLAG